jgi:uncharacterized protein DUF669
MRIDKPISEKEAESSGFTPWRPGDYDFEVNDASEERSSSTGNDMIKLTLHVFNEDGNKRTVFDYLVNSEKSQFKIRHFADAVGLIASYERGELDVNEIVAKTGRLKLRIKPAQGDYPANNSVGDYIPRGDLPEKVTRPAARPSAPASAATRVNVDLDDEIPF